MNPARLVAHIQVARDEMANASAKIVGTVDALLNHNAITSEAGVRSLREYVSEYNEAQKALLKFCAEAEAAAQAAVDEEVPA